MIQRSRRTPRNPKSAMPLQGILTVSPSSKCLSAFIFAPTGKGSFGAKNKSISSPSAPSFLSFLGVLCDLCGEMLFRSERGCLQRNWFRVNHGDQLFAFLFSQF